MNEKEIESMGFRDEWLDDDFNDHGSRRDNLGMSDFEVTKAIYEVGGLDAVDAYLNSTASAWSCADSLIRVVDSLFGVTKFGTDDELYSKLVSRVLREVFESMILAFENAECHVDYDIDPYDKAEGYIRGFSYSIIDDLDAIISNELGRVAKADVGLESILKQAEERIKDLRVGDKI